MSKPETLRQRDQALWEAALAMTPGLDDQTRAKEDVLKSLDIVLPPDDLEKQRRQKCERFFQQMTHPGATEPEGQLLLFGDLYDYEGSRPVIGPDDRIVEQKFALPAYKVAEAARSRDVARAQQVWADRKTREAEEYSTWALKQAL